MSSWIKIIVLLNISLNYISRLFVEISFVSLCQLLFSVVREHRTQDYVIKIPRLSNKYGVLEVKYQRKWFWDLFLITSVHSSFRQLALGNIQKWLVGRVILEIELKYDLFREVLVKAHYYPLYTT